jgi:hypothetical protein
MTAPPDTTISKIEAAGQRKQRIDALHDQVPEAKAAAVDQLERVRVAANRMVAATTDHTRELDALHDIEKEHFDLFTELERLEAEERAGQRDDNAGDQ